MNIINALFKLIGFSALLMLFTQLSAQDTPNIETAIETVAEAVEEIPAEISAGDTAWMITATALVLFMTLPGLALFYAGLVRSKNVLSILMQCFMQVWCARKMFSLSLCSVFCNGRSDDHSLGVVRLQLCLCRGQ